MGKTGLNRSVVIGYTIKFLMAIVLLFLSSSLVFAQDPDCTGADRYPTMMAVVRLRNAGITNSRPIDFAKIETIRLASERIGNDLYRQIHHITFIENSGNNIKVITNNDVSSEECSMSGVQVYVISQHLKDPYP